MVDDNQDDTTFGTVEEETKLRQDYAKGSMNIVTSFFIKMFMSVWSGFSDHMIQLAKNIWRGVEIHYDSAIETDQWDKMLDTFKDAGMISAESKIALMTLKDTPAPADWIFYMMTFYGIIKDYAATTNYASGADTRRALFAKYSPELPGARDVLGAAFIAPEKTQEVRNIMKMSGLSDEHIDLMFLANYQLYDVNTIRTLYLRGELNVDQMFMRMRELGFTDVRIKEIIKTWEIIPPINDIIMMVAKEAFEPDLIKLLGLDAELPVGQYEWLKKQGLSEEWINKYWYAHWDVPSVQQGLEMVHRGVLKIEELDILYKAAEVPPFWRDKMTAIAYNPYTRVDVRRMHQLGVLSDDELTTAYTDAGYSPEKAGKMALFTVRYNQDRQKRLTFAQVIKGFKERIIPRQEAKELLLQLKYDDDQAEYQLMYADYEIQKEYQDAMLDNIKTRFQNNLTTELDTLQALNNLNLPAEQIEILMDNWKIKRMIDVKVPSKTDLDKFLAKKIINKDEYRQEMEKLGYNYRYIGWYEKLTGVKQGE